jgi:hypothetical protein
MSVWVILFAKLTLGSVLIKQPFSPYVGSQSEGFSYTLTDYFIGPNLQYSISSDADTPWTTTMDDPFNFQMASQKAFAKGTSADNLSNNRKLRSYSDLTNSTCVLAYYSNNLTSYKLYNNTFTYQWSTLVDNTAKNAFIQDIAFSREFDYIYAVVAYTTGTLTVTHHSNVFIGTKFLEGSPNFVEVPGYSLTPSQSIRIEIGSSFSAILNSTSNEMSSVGTVSVFNITDPSNPLYIGTATSTQNPVDLSFYDAQTLIISDNTQGLQKYQLSNSSVVISNGLNLTGTSSLDISGAYGAVALNNSVVMVDLEALVVYDIVNLYSNNASVPAKAVAGKLVGEFGFVNTITINSNLAVVDFELLPEQGQVKNWNLAAIQTGSFDQYGPFHIFPNDDGTFTYVRMDNSLVTACSLTVGYWTLNGFTNSQNFTANVTGFVGGNATLQATLEFTGVSVSPNSLIPYHNNSVIPLEEVGYDLDTTSIYLDLAPIMYPNLYFGGPYQAYNVSVSTLLPNILITVDLPSKAATSSLGTYTNLTTLSGDSSTFILSDGETVTAYNLTEGQAESGLSFNFSTFYPGAAVTATLWTNGGIVAYSSAGPAIVAVYDQSSSQVDLGQNCSQFKVYQQYVFCGNTTSVQVFLFEHLLSESVAYLDATTFGVDSLNFSDFTFCTGTADLTSLDYLVLVDASGLWTASLDQLGELSPQFSISGPFGSSADVMQAFTTGDQFVLMHSDGSVDIYAANYASLPTLSRQLAGKGGASSAAVGGGVMAVQYADSVDVIDLYADAVNGFYTNYSASACQTAAVSNVTTYILSMCTAPSLHKASTVHNLAPISISSVASPVSVTSTAINGVRSSPSSALDYPVTFVIKTTEPYIQTLATVATGNVTAYNSYGSASLSFNITVANESPYLISNFSQESLSVMSNVSLDIALLSYFIGQDLEFAVNINGEYVEYNYTQFNYVPVVLEPKDLSQGNNSALEVLDFDVCLGCAASAVLTPSTIYLVDNQDPTNYLGNVSYSYPYTACNSISSLNLGNSTYQVFINCNSNLTALSDNPLNTSRISATVQLGSDSTVLTYKAVPGVYSFIKTVPLSSTSCLIYQVTDNREGDGQFAETRYYVSYFYYFLEIPAEIDSEVEFSFEDFGIDSLSISALDSYFITTDQAVVYMADATWGIRVFNVSYDTQQATIQQVLVNSVETPSITPVSIGVCGDWLFVGGSKEEVYQYDLSQGAASPLFVKAFYTTGNFTGVNGNIDCNAQFDPAYAVVPMNSASGNFTARVLSLQAPSSNSIYADLTFPSNVTSQASFTNSSRVRGQSGSELLDFSISTPYLSIQSMTLDQFGMMVDYYGTSVYDVFLTVSNEVLAVNTTTFTLTRTAAPTPPTPVPPTPDPDDQDDSDDDDDSGVGLVAGVLGVLSLA